MPSPPNHPPIAPTLLALALVAVTSIALAQILLQPNRLQSRDLAVVLTIPAVLAAFALPLVRRWVARRERVAGVVIAAGVAALIFGLAVSAAASEAMFVSDHDFRMFLVMMTLACGTGVVIGRDLTRSLTRDLGHLVRTIAWVGEGRLNVHADLARRDEIGSAANAFDELVDRLSAADEQRKVLTSARDTMLASVSHDLRTPLTAARAAIESVRDGVAIDTDRYLGLAGAHLYTCERLLEQLADYARVGSAPPEFAGEPVSCAELLDDAMESLGPVAERHLVTLSAQLTCPGLVNGEPSDLGRVWRNLLDNGIRHGGSGGRVAASVEERADSVVVRVSDTGAGFPDGFRSAAFEPFSQADSARTRVGASGLGLAICRSIVERHGGSIRLGPGPGGDVIVELPRLRPRVVS